VNAGDVCACGNAAVAEPHHRGAVGCSWWAVEQRVAKAVDAPSAAPWTSPPCKCGAPLSEHAVCGQYDGGCFRTRCDGYERAPAVKAPAQCNCGGATATGRGIAPHDLGVGDCVYRPTAPDGSCRGACTCKGHPCDAAKRAAREAAYVADTRAQFGHAPDLRDRLTARLTYLAVGLTDEGLAALVERAETLTVDHARPLTSGALAKAQQEREAEPIEQGCTVRAGRLLHGRGCQCPPRDPAAPIEQAPPMAGKRWIASPGGL
jgi:hypothetical protein